MLIVPPAQTTTSSLHLCPALGNRPPQKRVEEIPPPFPLPAPPMHSGPAVCPICGPPPLCTSRPPAAGTNPEPTSKIRVPAPYAYKICSPSSPLISTQDTLCKTGPHRTNPLYIPDCHPHTKQGQQSRRQTRRPPPPLVNTGHSCSHTPQTRQRWIKLDDGQCGSGRAINRFGSETDTTRGNKLEVYEAEPHATLTETRDAPCPNSHVR